MAEEVAVVVSDWIERDVTDRRRTTFRSLFFGPMIHGRRRRARRQTDAHAHYVARYDERLFAVSLGILLLCCLDALFTLELLGMGAREINLFMAALLDIGIATFVSTKLALTGIGVVFLVAHAAFRVGGTLRVRHILYTILGSYMTLFVYQVWGLACVF